MKKNKIARIVLDELGFQDNYTYLLRKFFEKNHQKAHFEFLTLAGGFYEKSFPNKLLKYSIEELENTHIEDIIKIYEKEIEVDFQKFEEFLKIPFAEVVDYITLGVDGKVFDEFGYVQDDKHIELVTIYDTKQKKLIHWTGKFYPLENQKKNLVKINDLDSHFITLNNQKIMVLGCHDLSVYNPRGQANSKPNSWKSEKSEEFREKARAFAPSIVLQHPHTTDTPNIWNTSWKVLERDLPSVEHYVSGILYFNPNEDVRADLDKVLEGTQKGDVKNFSRESLA